VPDPSSPASDLSVLVTPAMVAYGRALAEPRISPDGTEVAYVATVNRRAALTVVPVDGGADEVLTSDLVPKGSGGYGGGAFAWLPDGRGFVVAASGDLWLVPRRGGPARQLTTLGPDGAVGAPAVSPDGRAVAFTSDLRVVLVVRLDRDGREPVRLSAGADFAADPAWSADGSAVVWQEWDVPAMPWDDSRLVVRRVGPSSAVEVLHHAPDRQSLQAQPSPVDPTRVAFLTDATGWLNVTEVDATGRARTLVAEAREHGQPTWVQGQRSFAWSPDGGRLAFHRNEDGFGRLCVIDLASGAVREVAKGWHEGLTWRDDRLVAVRSGARTPTQLVAYDTTTWGRTLLARGPVAGWDGVLDEPDLVTWDAEDGAVVHGRLYRPRVPATGAGTRPPMLVWTHGGPTSQWGVSFLARIAYYAARGWAVLLADHRGSTGHGRDYTMAMRGRWGELDVSDTAAGIRAAIERGWCDPTRVVAIGGSAGGFTSYLLLARHPELLAAGVVAYGVADLASLDQTSHRFEAHYNQTLVGPPEVAAARYAERSPIHLAERITAPLLILQGTDDAVVAPEQSASIVERLQALGRIVEHQVYEGEGHGWSKPETVVDELERTDDFLRRHVLRCPR
jgi:dipeptidyl aminopeptidase/acylaminoacyl peptidase